MFFKEESLYSSASSASRTLQYKATITVNCYPILCSLMSYVHREADAAVLQKSCGPCGFWHKCLGKEEKNDQFVT